MSNQTERLKALVDAWDPAGDAELPDEVAVALDGDAELRAFVDAKFAPTAIPKQPVPAGLTARLPPIDGAPSSYAPSRKPMWAIAGGVGLLSAAAAASLFIVFGGGGVSMFVFSASEQADMSASEASSMEGEEVRRLREERSRATAEREAASVAEAPAWDADGFVDYGANGFVRTADDPQSTFAIDVDTGSYTLARRKLREGMLPNPAGVRVEEFVNYLPYDYAPPTDGATFSATFVGAPSPWGDDHVFVSVGLQGRVEDGPRKASHLTFLVDVSGSMEGEDRLQLVQKSLTLLVGELAPTDTVSLVVYAGATGVVLEPTQVSEKAEILGAIDRLQAGGGTAMGQGIEAAYAMADRSFVKGANNRVILCSDGDANVGQVHTGTLSEFIRGYADRGITLTTLGFGTGNYQDSRMEQLADDGDGNYAYIDGEHEARRVFVDHLTSTLEVIADDAKIQVEWNPKAVERYRLIGYENRDVADKDFRNDAVDGGEIGAGHQVTALYELDLVDAPAKKLGTLHVRTQAPGAPATEVTERTYDLDRGAIVGDFDVASPSFRMAFAAAEFAEVLRASPFAASIDLERLAGIARDAADVRHEEHAELVGLIELATGLARPTRGTLSPSSVTTTTTTRPTGKTTPTIKRTVATPVPTNAPPAVLKLHSDASGKLMCSDGQSPSFTGVATVDFEAHTLPVTCMVTIDGKRGAFSVERDTSVRCSRQGNEVRCDAGEPEPPVRIKIR